MRSSTVFASALAFAASAFAQTAGYAVMSSPTEGSKVPSGKAFTIKWDAGSYTGQATVSLLGGASPSTLTPGPVLTTIDVTAGSFTWDVDCSLGTDKTYGIKIASVADASIFQYSFPFTIDGPSCGAETSSRSASTSVGGYPTADVSSSVIVSSSSAIGYSTTSVSSSVVSSAPSYPTATSVSSSVSNSTSSAVVPTYSATAPAYPSGNLSVTASYPATTLTSAVATTPSASATTSAPVTVVTGAAAANAAGSFALIGGMALAVLAI